MLDERAFVNGIAGLHATGGSTNHTLHIVAMAAAAGLRLTWTDFSDLAEVVPLLTRVYPNGKADVNHFHAAGGMSVVIRELLGEGLLHADVTTVFGEGLAAYTSEPVLSEAGHLSWREGPQTSADEAVLRGARAPFHPTGGLKVLDGRSRPRHHQDLRRSRAERHVIEGPGPHLPLAGGVPGGLQGGPVEGRPRGRRALPGSQGQRHARTAQADVAARGSAGPGPEGGARHRRPAVGAPRARSRPPSM